MTHSATDCKPPPQAPKAEVAITGPIDGMGTPDRSGSYLLLHVNGQRFRVSLGAAEVLAAEILGVLGTAAA